jgi:L-rhamnose isomerase
MALITPNYTALQNDDNWTELMVLQEEMKTMPFGEIWAEYCRVCGAPEDGCWFADVKKYETEVLSKRG